MKKITIALLLLIASISAKEITVNNKLSYTYVNTTFGTKQVKDITINYETEKDEFYISFYGATEVVAFVLKDSRDLDLRYSLKKYKNWNKKASTKGITLVKDIKTVTAYGTYFRQFDEWHVGPAAFTYRFISESKSKHFIALVGSVQSNYNQFSKAKIWFCLSYKQARDLSRALSPKSLAAYKKKAKKKDLDISEFN